MAKRNLERKREAREAREVRKAAAAEARREFRRETNSCQCGTVLEPWEYTPVATGKTFVMDTCPRCYDQASV